MAPRRVPACCLPCRPTARAAIWTWSSRVTASNCSGCCSHHQEHEMNTVAYDVPVPLMRRLSWQDWVYALLLAAGAVFAFIRYGEYMDVYETGFLFSAAAVFSWLGWQWKAMRPLVIGVGAISLFAISLYGGNQANAEQVFFLKSLISSQSAVMWMNVLFVLARIAYWLALFARWDFAGKVASGLTWSAVLMGFVGLMV